MIRTGHPLSVELAPGLLSGIFDGIQRPLKDIHQFTGSIYIPRGINLPSISRTNLWEFHPLNLKKGTCVTGGDVIGYVYENKLVKHKITLSPKYCGRVRKQKKQLLNILFLYIHYSRIVILTFRFS